MESRSGGDLIIWLAGLVAMSPFLPLAVGFLGYLCGWVPGADFLCAASPGRHSIQSIGLVYGTFGFLVTIPIGIILALLGVLVNSLQDTDVPSPAVNSAVHDSGESRDKCSEDMMVQREPRAERAADGADTGHPLRGLVASTAAVAKPQAGAGPVVAERTNWVLKTIGVALVALGLLCFAPFFYQDAETLRETAIGGFVMACLGIGLLIGGAICLTRSAATGAKEETAREPVESMKVLRRPTRY